jgi:hypothetical protein
LFGFSSSVEKPDSAAASSPCVIGPWAGAALASAFAAAELARIIAQVVGFKRCSPNTNDGDGGKQGCYQGFDHNIHMLVLTRKSCEAVYVEQGDDTRADHQAAFKPMRCPAPQQDAAANEQGEGGQHRKS